jgi:hypothetical protein
MQVRSEQLFARIQVQYIDLSLGGKMMKYTLLFMMAVGAICSALAFEKTLIVEIGASASQVKRAFSHNISMAALEDGDSEFEVKATNDEAYTIELTEQEIDDILNGTTVHVETLEGDMVVQIRIVDSKPKSSGW